MTATEMSPAGQRSEIVTIAEAVQAAVEFHRAGRLFEARIIYERVLAVAPDDADALHFLGLLHHQIGNPEQALDSLHRAVKAQPDYAAAYNNLGNLQQEMGDQEGAERSYRRTLELVPGFVDALNNLGILLKRRGLDGEAEQAYRRAIELAPDHAEAYNNLGHLLFSAGRIEEALDQLEHAISLDPQFAEAFHNLGHTLAALDRPQASGQAYRRAVDLGANAYLGLATSLQEQGMVEEAIEAYRKAIRIDSSQDTAFYNLGMLLSAWNRVAEATDTYRQWLGHAPNDPVAQHMLAACTADTVPARASDRYVRAVFDGFAPSFDRRLKNLAYRAPELVVEELGRCVGTARADLSILDAGCGTGLCGPLLAPYGANLTGVDLSEPMLALARQRGSYDQLIRAELTQYLAETTKRYNALISADTLVYFGDLEPVIRAAARALTADGVLIATLEHCADSDCQTFRLNTHGRYSHSDRYVRSVLSDNGFDAIRTASAALREELGQPVMGLLISAKKASS